MPGSRPRPSLVTVWNGRVDARPAVAVAQVHEHVRALGGRLHLGPRRVRRVDLDDVRRCSASPRRRCRWRRPCSGRWGCRRDRRRRRPWRSTPRGRGQRASPARRARADRVAMRARRKGSDSSVRGRAPEPRTASSPNRTRPTTGGRSRPDPERWSWAGGARHLPPERARRRRRRHHGGMSHLPARTGADVHLADAFGVPGCPLCRERERTEAAYLESILAESVNDVPYPPGARRRARVLRRALPGGAGGGPAPVRDARRGDPAAGDARGPAARPGGDACGRWLDAFADDRRRRPGRRRARPAPGSRSRTAGWWRGWSASPEDPAWAEAVATAPFCLDHLVALMDRRHGARVVAGDRGAPAGAPARPARPPRAVRARVRARPEAPPDRRPARGRWTRSPTCWPAREPSARRE